MTTGLIWDKGGSHVNANVQRFLAGDDVVLDRTLFPFDVQATIAHVRGLQRIKILSNNECTALVEKLHQLQAEFKADTFVLNEQFEDGHSAIESYLTEQLGDVGRKVHTGRSRNDQVQVALRLYMKHVLKQADQTVHETAQACLDIAGREERTPMPGYTHLQRAVPSSIGTWMASYAEAFTDTIELLRMAARWVDTCPLGTAAGYGVNLPLDRTGVAAELGFARLQLNALYAQTSRGMHEVQVLSALGQAALMVRRLAWDLSLFTTSEFAFIYLPDEYTTGSSIMPNKRNPDVIELLRTTSAVVWSAVQEITSVLALPAGYHRDLQATKAPFIRACESTLQTLAVLPDLIRGLRFDRARMRAGIDEDMYATDRAINLARAGRPFRAAYRDAAPAAERQQLQQEYGKSSEAHEENAAATTHTPEASLAARTSPGGPGDLKLNELATRLASLK